MPHYVGLDASKATTSICVTNDYGETVREGVVETTPKVIINNLRGERRRYARVGIESMSMASWLYEGLARAGLPIICIETKHAHGVLKNQRNKTDRNDARGIAEIMRAGIYKAVHVKTAESQAGRVLLTTRKLLVEKRRDIDNLIRGLLLQFGLKLAPLKPTSFEQRARDLRAKVPELKTAQEALLAVRAVLNARIAALDETIRRRVDEDPVCARLMTAPGVGPLAALAYRTAVDVPQRFARSQDVGVHLGLTPRTYQSGQSERRGRVSKCGDRGARAALFLSAKVLLSRRTRTCALKTWGLQVAVRRGYMKAVIAVARRLAVTLHMMWITGTDFRREALAG